MRGVFTVLIAVGLWLTVEAAAIKRTDPCYIQPETLKAAVRDMGKWKALCEESMYKSAACSNYWADVEEVRYLTAKFQRCLENTAALFRAWVYGDSQAAIPGAFVYQGVLDRVAVTNMQNALQDLAYSTYERTLNLSATLHNTNLATYLSAVNNDAIQSNNEMDTQSNLIQTTVHNEYQSTRDTVDADHTVTRTFVSQSSSTDRQTELSAATSDRDRLDSEYSSTVANNANEGAKTRADEDQQSQMTRTLASSEYNSIRTLETTQTTSTRAFHTSTLASTKTMLINEIDVQEQQTRDTSATEGKSTRSVVDAQAAQTQTTIRTEESNTVSKITTAVHNSTTVTNIQVQTSNNNERSDEQSAQTNVRNNVASTAQKIRSAETSAGQTVRSAVSADLSDVNGTASAAASATRDYFANTASPQILTSLSAVLPILKNESDSLMSFMMHFNLANVACFWARQTTVDLFLRPDDPNYFRILQGTINNTVAYNVRKYGSTSCGNAVSYLNNGHAQANAQNYKSAFSWYRAAYKDATIARNL